MSEKKETVISEPALEFVSYYQKEMRRNIADIRKLISDVENQEDTENLLQEIKKSGLAMSDLAMVYGFESEEVIGRTIVMMVDTHDKENDSEKLISNLIDSVKAAEAVLLVSEKEKEKDGNKIIKYNAEEDSVTISSEEVDEGDENGLIFDIKEDEGLISLIKGEYSITTSTIKSTNFEDGVAENSFLPKDQNRSLKFDIPEEDDSSSEIQSSFTELDDVLEINFVEKPVVTQKEQKSIFKKITDLFSSKN
ncbi:hypothetical protein IIC38_00235 [candidate division KSB1 bacterium]|nr:hypothetical protein [candidate division KSB1 bacterium]